MSAASVAKWAKEKKGEKIIDPGLPLPESERSAFATNDCIQPPPL